jgi:hypothetical protein
MSLRYLIKAFAGGLVHRPLLLIYQMGKVGSQTIEATLRNACPGRPIFRVHYLSRQQVQLVGARLQLQIFSDQAKASLRRQIKLANLLRHAVRARQKLRSLGIKGDKLHVIAGVRDPIALMLASIFQNHTAYFASLDEIDAINCQNLLLGRTENVERRQYIEQLQQTTHSWFDTELRALIGMDVFEMPFPWNKGHQIYENEFARVLVYRYENFEAIGQMMEEFLGLNVPAIVNQNLSSAKDYSPQYEKVRRELRLPVKFLAQQYNTRLATHFYSGAEREQFACRWQDGK